MNLTENVLNQIIAFNDTGEDFNLEDIEIVYRDKFTSHDGDSMKRGFYFIYKEYPEEGLIGPFIDNEDYCDKCHEKWLEHDFGVPEPYCP